MQTLEGHEDEVRALAYSPDGSTLASGSRDNTVRLWDARSGEGLKTLEGHMDEVTSVAFSPDGFTLASGGEWHDRTVRLWDVRNVSGLQILEGHAEEVTSVAFSPDGFTLASGSEDGTMLLWEYRRRVTTWGAIKQIEVIDGTKPLLERSPLVAPATPTETALLPNYPNPFNPETWIPYQLAKLAEVNVTIYDMNGEWVRTLAVGHQPAGVYRSRSRAAYWDGRNQQRETVANGVYFCTLRAGDYTATRKMLIGK